MTDVQISVRTIGAGIPATTNHTMSYRRFDSWSKQLPDGRTVDYIYTTLFLANNKSTSWAVATMSGVMVKDVRNLATDMGRSQVEALFQNDL